MGLVAQDYTTDKVDIADLYPGFCELRVSAAATGGGGDQGVAGQ